MNNEEFKQYKNQKIDGLLRQLDFQQEELKKICYEPEEVQKIRQEAEKAEEEQKNYKYILMTSKYFVQIQKKYNEHGIETKNSNYWYISGLKIIINNDITTDYKLITEEELPMLSKEKIKELLNDLETALKVNKTFLIDNEMKKNVSEILTKEINILMYVLGETKIII